MDTRQSLTAMNAAQNQGEQYRPNIVGNLSVEAPTVAQLNAAISGSQMPQVVDRVEAPFGEHAREAADVVRRVFRR